MHCPKKNGCERSTAHTSAICTLVQILYQWIFQNATLVGLMWQLFCNSSLFAQQRHYNLSLKQEHGKGEREHFYYLHLDNSTVSGNPGHVVTLDTLPFRGEKSISERPGILEIISAHWRHSDGEKSDSPRPFMCVCVHCRQRRTTYTYSKGHQMAEWKVYSLLLQKAELWSRCRFRLSIRNQASELLNNRRGCLTRVLSSYSGSIQSEEE